MLAYVVAPENLTSVLVRLISHVLGLSLLLTTVRQTAPRPNKYRSVYPGRLQPHTIPRTILFRYLETSFRRSDFSCDSSIRTYNTYKVAYTNMYVGS